jgi:RimJ/RimL family protein N-acetyltransferase
VSQYESINQITFDALEKQIDEKNDGEWFFIET